MAEINFNAESVDPGQMSYEVIPPGWYQAQIVASEMRPTGDGAGQFLQLEFDILDGGLSGRKVWDRLNLDNPNSQAVEIAQRTLSRLCRAIGVMHVSDSEELHFKPMQIKVTVRPERTDSKTGKTYDPSNEIKGYKPLENGASPAPAPQQQHSTAPAAQHQAAPPPQQASRAAMPWDKAKAV